MKLDLEAAELTKKLQDCKIAEEESKPNDSIAAYEYIITYKFRNEDGVDLTEECIKAKEQAVYRLAAIFQ